MRMHPDAVDVQEVCCRLLSNLAAQKVLDTLVVFAGGIERTVVAMHGHDAVGVMEAACKTLRTLSLTSTSNQIHITRAGGIKGILLALSSVEQFLHKAACAALLALSCTPALDIMLAKGVPQKVKFVISLPDVGDETRRMGKELLSRLKAEALSKSSPLASPMRAARLGKASSASAAMALENPSSPGAKSLRKTLSHDDLNASTTSPSSASSSSSSSPKSLLKLSRRRSIADHEPAAQYSTKVAHTLLKLPTVEGGRGAGSGMAVGTPGFGKSLQSAGSKAKEILSSAGSRLSLSSLPGVRAIWG